MPATDFENAFKVLGEPPPEKVWLVVDAMSIHLNLFRRLNDDIPALLTILNNIYGTPSIERVTLVFDNLNPERVSHAKAKTHVARRVKARERMFKIRKIEKRIRELADAPLTPKGKLTRRTRNSMYWLNKRLEAEKKKIWWPTTPWLSEFSEALINDTNGKIVAVDASFEADVFIGTAAFESEANDETAMVVYSADSDIAIGYEWVKHMIKPEFSSNSNTTASIYIESIDCRWTSTVCCRQQRSCVHTIAVDAENARFVRCLEQK